jgi:tRNA/tmRNA/rRNA uracil-C5-methylase (TrmA/RlmC/RlmD family)
MTDGLAVGDEVELEVGAVAHGGHCVARVAGQVVFVRHALPGERVVARVTEVGGGARFVRADAVTVLQPSSGRREPPCRYAGPGGCGGCDFQHADPEHGRALKAAVVSEQLRRLAKVDLDVVVEPLPGASDGLRWRSRQRFAVGPDGRAGLRRHRSHEIVPVADCLIAAEAVTASGVLSRSWTGVEAVDVVAPGDGSAAVVIPERDGGARGPQVHEPVRGRRWSGELSVAATGFWQVHPGAPAAYVDHVLDVLQPATGERMLDLYAGAGLFAVPLADAVGATGHVDAVESDRQAVADGIRNATGRPQLRYHRGRVDAVLRRLARAGRVDGVVLDPPRAGAGSAVIRMILGQRPRRVVYVACDPAALARDTAYAMERGYALTGLRAFDAFPMTHHVECIATFARRT